jgi:hypothetical protein
MTCPHCGFAIPVAHLSCAACIAARSFREVIARQRDVLPEVAAGTRDLRLAKVAAGVHHVILFGHVNRTWCGMDLHRYQVKYSALSRLPIGVCWACIKVLSKAIEEVETAA